MEKIEGASSRFVRDELRRVSRQRSLDVLQLQNLLEVGRELAGCAEERAVHEIVIQSALAHFLVSRGAIYALTPNGLALVAERGPRREREEPPIPPEEALAGLAGLPAARAVAELPPGTLRRRLERARLVLAAPLVSGGRAEGLLALGDRASGTPFSAADRDFAEALARQAQAALERARLQRVREEKRRQDGELEIARQIQAALFPRHAPELPGFEVAGESHACHEVGGDSYDWIPLEGDRLALLVADVSGKGTPASLLMASVHAFVRALAGTVEPARVVERLDAFLLASTQPSRFVTLFYGELHTRSRRLRYVNAGHIPPFRLTAAGGLSRLTEGGPAAGLLDDAAYPIGELSLQPGDVLAVVTDGVTEAGLPSGREFGDEGVSAVLRERAGEPASAIVAGLVRGVSAWTGGGPPADDLTALVLKAR